MGLAEYRRKRDFSKTAEPSGKAKGSRAKAINRTVAKKSTLRFVIQKHDVTRLHYDLRLEWDGVFKSWAVPKGPSFNPADKRLAVEVEDHPLEYGKFEGVIPAGEYGAGPVIVWDRGTWTPENDAAQGVKRGKLEFSLHGEKLHGSWVLVRSRAAHGGKNQWLLIKRHDDEATERGSIVDDQPDSVASGRSIEEVLSGVSAKKAAKARSPVNRSAKKSAAKNSASRISSTHIKAARSKSGLKKNDAARPVSRNGQAASRGRKSLPAMTAQLATLAQEPPIGDDWLHEVKFDGYRVLCTVDGGEASLVSRNKLDWTEKLPEVAEAAAKLKVRGAVLDGEVVALDDHGVSNFQALQNALSERRTGGLVYYVFDLLSVDGEDLRNLPLEERKSRLAKLVRSTSAGRLRFSEHITGSGATFLAEACRQGLEGIVSKRRNSVYTGERSTDWIKTKCSRRQEFVIGGFTAPEGGRVGFGALLLGYYDKERKLHYAGRVGTGFSDQTLRELENKLKPLRQAASPFVDFPVRGSGGVGTTWTAPKLVGEVRFTEWTSDGRLRHPAFQGLRMDKKPNEVKRERAMAATSAAKANASQRKSTKTAMRASAAKTTSTKAGAQRKSNKGRTARTRKSGAKMSSTVDAKEDGSSTFAGVTLTHPEKLLFPADKLTKRDIAEYYAAVELWMLPHVAGRPVGILRCPDGAGKPCFVQKHPGNAAPAALRRVAISEKSGEEEYLVADDLAGIVALVQIGGLEIHIWGCHADKVEFPDQLVFDLDPDEGVPWKRVTAAAIEVRDVLAELGLTSFCKTTGGKGLHIVAPIERRTTWDDAKAFSRGVADFLVTHKPAQYTANLSKAARGGRIFIDYLRNGRGATAVAPYSTRARKHATVATPVTWEEVRDGIEADAFDVAGVLARMRRRKRDPWAEFFDVRQSITKEMMRRVAGK